MLGTEPGATDSVVELRLRWPFFLGVFIHAEYEKFKKRQYGMAL